MVIVIVVIVTALYYYHFYCYCSYKISLFKHFGHMHGRRACSCHTPRLGPRLDIPCISIPGTL